MVDKQIVSGSAINHGTMNLAMSVNGVDINDYIRGIGGIRLG